MKTIWKFEIDIIDKFTLEMPNGAEIMTIQTQFEKPCIWAIVEPSNELEKRHFEIKGTGHPFQEDAENNRSRTYIGTFQLASGQLVFHLFET